MKWVPVFANNHRQSAYKLSAADVQQPRHKDWVNAFTGLKRLLDHKTVFDEVRRDG